MARRARSRGARRIRNANYKANIKQYHRNRSLRELVVHHGRHLLGQHEAGHFLTSVIAGQPTLLLTVLHLDRLAPAAIHHLGIPVF